MQLFFDLGLVPSVAQLEERGTVIGNKCMRSSQGHWFDPGLRDSFCFPLAEDVA